MGMTKPLFSKCKHCGKEFQQKYFGRKAIFCSDLCRVNFYNSEYAKRRVYRSCVVCNQPLHGKQITAYFCGGRCRKRAFDKGVTVEKLKQVYGGDFRQTNFDDLFSEYR